jgi:hypothetical protein
VLCFAQSTSPNDGSVEDNVYTNFFFQLRYPFSASWVPLSDATSEQIHEAVQAHLGTNSATLEAPAKGSHTLLTLARNLPGSAGTHSRAIILLIADDVSSDAKVTSAKDCVVKLAERLKKAHYTAVKDPQEVQLSGRTFFRQDLKGTTSAGAPVYESVFFTLAKGYALGFILTAPNEQMRGSMVEGLGKVKFF